MAGAVMVLVAVAVVLPLVLMGGADARSETAQDGPTTASTSTPGSSTSTSVPVIVPAPDDLPEQPPVTSPVVPPAGATSPGVAILLADGDTLDAVVVFQPTVSGGVLLGMPAATLLRTAESFRTIADLHASGDLEALPAGLETILGVPPAAVGSLETGELEQALQEAGFAGTWSAGSETGPEAVRQAADVFLQLARSAATYPQIWDGLTVEGDAAAVRETLAGLAANSPGTDWHAAVLPGTVVAGEGFEYFEADVVATRKLVAGGALAIAPVDIVLTVQNGSGAVRAAEAAAERLVPLGHTLAPFENAPGFPDVSETVISASPDAVPEAQQIRTLLGVGRVVEDASLQAGHIVVVVGRDFAPPLPTARVWSVTGMGDG